MILCPYLVEKSRIYENEYRYSYRLYASEGDTFPELIDASVRHCNSKAEFVQVVTNMSAKWFGNSPSDYDTITVHCELFNAIEY